ncbi:MAG: branched-chain amino acid ABC transporter permease [Armatimonadota bacterium]|nr:branched-chain amino acid ABC transporter permease [Armatimonadota bacterium]
MRAGAWRLTGPGVAGVLAALAGLPLVTQRADVLNLAFLVFLYAALAESWNLLAGFAGQVNLGHAAFFGTGAFVMRHLWVAGVHPYLGLLAGGLAASAFSLVIGLPAFRLRGAYFAIGTLGLAEILRITVGNVLPVVSTLPAPFITGYSLVHRYYLALALLVVTVATVAWLVRSPLGLGLVALREDEDAAAATGVDVVRHKLLALVVSTGLGGMAGAVFAFYHTSYYHQMPFGPGWTFDALLIAFVGGVGTLAGPLVGAVFYVLVREVLAQALVDVHLLIFGLLFVVVVLVLPGGLVEAAARARRAIGAWRGRTAGHGGRRERAAQGVRSASGGAPVGAAFPDPAGDRAAAPGLTDRSKTAREEGDSHSRPGGAHAARGEEES